jgi:PEP-CTERM motif-containing protein
MDVRRLRNFLRCVVGSLCLLASGRMLTTRRTALRALMVCVTVDLFLVGVFVSPSPVRAAAFGGSASGFAAGCSSGHTPYGPMPLGVTGQASGVCNVFIPNGTGTVSSKANTFTSSDFQISGGAQTQNVGVSLFGRADSFDTVTVSPPAGSSISAADIQAGDLYQIDIDGANMPMFAGIPGDGSVPFGFSLAEVFVGVRLTPSFSTTFPVEDSVTKTTDGSFSGVLLTSPMTILGCPCELLFELHGFVGTANGTTFAGFHDAPFLIVPPGWTYTFASQTTSTVPEPNSLILLTSGLCALGIGIRRRWTNRFRERIPYTTQVGKA